MFSNQTSLLNVSLPKPRQAFGNISVTLITKPMALRLAHRNLSSNVFNGISIFFYCRKYISTYLFELEISAKYNLESIHCNVKQRRKNSQSMIGFMNILIARLLKVIFLTITKIQPKILLKLVKWSVSLSSDAIYQDRKHESVVNLDETYCNYIDFIHNDHQRASFSHFRTEM